MKKISIIVVVVVLIVGGWFWYSKLNFKEQTVDSYKDATYIIDNQSIKLTNGLSETTIVPGSASKIITKYFGNEVKRDFNGDGREDVAFLLTQETGGSGTFYYVVVALNTISGYVGTHATIIGDRIAPQTTEVNEKGFIVVNYADRKSGESFAVPPSLGKSLYLKFDPINMDLGEVVQNFEGEADPSRMTLGMKTWNWISTIYNDGKNILPKKTSAFTLTFNKDGTFSAKTDCNGVGGKYSINKNEILFSQMMSTLMYCDGSQESEFTKELGEVQSYLFTSKGELVLEFKMDSGSMVFR